MPSPLLIAFPLGLAAFALIIPFIIIYLRKPKPTEKTIPSLMFLMKNEQKEKKFSFLRRLIQNLIFYLQLLILLSLAFAVSEPFMKLMMDTSAKNTVIVIDGSASMAAKDGFSTRFENAVSKAKSEASGKTSVILALDQPTIVLDKGWKSEASSILSSLQPYDTSTNIEGAMYEAENLLKEETGKIIIISDFITDKETDQPLKARRILSSKENSIKFIKVGDRVTNIGIVDLELLRSTFRVYIKNFNPDQEKVTIRHIKDGSTLEQKELTIYPNSIEITEFPMAEGQSTVELDIKDSFDPDNKVYISAPEQKNLKVLFLSNKDRTYLMDAIRSLRGVDLEIRKPPIVKAYELDHDIIVISDVTESILPADVKDIADYIGKGHALIIAAHDKLPSLGLEQLNPVNLGPPVTKNVGVKVEIINEFTKDIDLNTTRRYLRANAKNSTIAVASTMDDSPLIAYMPYGEGKTFYYGIFDDYSEFKKTMGYPVFWNKVISFLIESENINEYNFKVGDIGAQGIRKSGFYEREGKKIAVNLLNEKESDINRDSESLEDEIKFIENSTKRLSDFKLAVPLMVFALILMLLELIYVKRRGDL